jgi:hypothetical protein
MRTLLFCLASLFTLPALADTVDLLPTSCYTTSSPVFCAGATSDGRQYTLWPGQWATYQVSGASLVLELDDQLYWTSGVNGLESQVDTALYADDGSYVLVTYTLTSYRKYVSSGRAHYWRTAWKMAGTVTTP